MMTLLIKSVWRHVLRNGTPLSKSLRSFSSLPSEVTPSRTRSPDMLMTRIKDAPTASDILAAVQTHMPSLNHKHMLQALRCLFDLQKKGIAEDPPDRIIKDPTFSVLCQNFKRHARELELNEAIEATKVLAYLKVPVDTVIVQTMLQIIRCNINTLSTRQIMFLDFLLSRFDKRNHLADALMLALPLAFQIHLPTEIDNDIILLKDMLSYACNRDLPDRSINNIVTGLLLNDQDITPAVAKSVVWSLCQVNCESTLFPTRTQLLRICCDILTENIKSLSYDEVLKTAARIKGRILEKHEEYYHEHLMDAIAGYVVDNQLSFDQGLLVARVLSRVAHTHLGLTEYLCQVAVSNQNTLADARPNILIGFINCLSNNNYTPCPEHWQLLRDQISRNPVLDVKTNTLPLPKICLELASLGHYEDRMLAKVFSEDYVKELLQRDNTLDYLQLLTLNEAVKVFHNEKYSLPADVLRTARSLYPTHGLTDQLEDHLSRGLGGQEYVVKNVVLPNGIVSDCFICLKAGYPVKLSHRSEELKVPIEQLNLPPGSLSVCILNFQPGCFSMNSNRLRGTFRLVQDILEQQGYATVALNTTAWLSSPAHERIPYLLREVGYKCGELGVKLTAT